MKIFGILTLVTFISLFTDSAYSQNTPPPPPPPPQGPDDCVNDGDDYFAIVSKLKRDANLTVCEEDDSTYFTPTGELIVSAAFGKQSNSVYFKSNLDISNLVASNENTGYLHFMETSYKGVMNSLPDINKVLIDAVLTHQPMTSDWINSNKSREIRLNTSVWSLNIYYKIKGEVRSTSIDLDNKKTNFDVTIAWLNAGCIHDEKNCDESYGQLEIRVNYPNYEIVRIIKNLDYINVQNGTSYIVGTKNVYWSELDKENITGNLIMSRPE